MSPMLPSQGWWGLWGRGRGDLDGHRETPRILGPDEKSLSPTHTVSSATISLGGDGSLAIVPQKPTTLATTRVYGS